MDASSAALENRSRVCEVCLRAKRLATANGGGC
jgi:hypothetical protein